MFSINSLNSCEWITLASSLAISIGQNVSAEEASILASFFSALGDNLGIISAKIANNDNSYFNSNNSSCTKN